MYYNWGAAISGGLKAAGGDVPGAAMIAGAGLVPYGWTVGALPVVVNVGKWLGGSGGGPPEHLGFNMIANAPARVIGQDDAYVYFMLDMGERPDGYHLTQFRLNKQTGQVEYLRAGQGLVQPGYEQPETGEEVQGTTGYGSNATWVPLEGIIQHGAGMPQYLVDPNAFGIHLYWDVLKPLGLEGLWQGEPPPQQITPDMYQWQPGLESEHIPPEIAQSVEQQFAAGVVPAILPYYVKISNHGEVQGAYGAVPVAAQAATAGGGGIIDMATQQEGQVPTAQDWYGVAGNYANAATGYRPGSYVDAAFNYIASLLASGDLDTAQAAWLTNVLRQMEQVAQPVQPLQVGPFSVAPWGRMGLQQSNMAALNTLASQIADWEKQIQQRNLQRQGLGTQAAAQLGIAGEEALFNYARVNLELAAIAARLGMSQQELLYKYWQGQLDADTKKEVARIMGQYEVKARKEGQPPAWAYALQGAPGLVSLIGLGSSGLKGFFDWLGGSGSAGGTSNAGNWLQGAAADWLRDTANAGSWLYNAAYNWLLGI